MYNNTYSSPIYHTISCIPTLPLMYYSIKMLSTIVQGRPWFQRGRGSDKGSRCKQRLEGDG